MKVLNKANIPAPTLPKKVVPVPQLDGKVIIRGLLLSDRVAILNKARAGGLLISELLAKTVVDADGEPIYTSQEWEEFGASNFETCLDLFKEAKALSGLDAEVSEKKS